MLTLIWGSQPSNGGLKITGLIILHCLRLYPKFIKCVLFSSTIHSTNKNWTKYWKQKKTYCIKLLKRAHYFKAKGKTKKSSLGKSECFFSFTLQKWKFLCFSFTKMRYRNTPSNHLRLRLMRNLKGSLAGIIIIPK